MKQPTLAIFANFFIDNQERLQRMKDSFYSFKEANLNQWVINIRGSFKSQAGEFLKKEIGEKLQLFYFQSKKGWHHDSNIIASKISANYVLYWIEDHILIVSPTTLNNCVAEMSEFNVDQFWYSWFKSDVRNRFAIIEPHKVGKNITVRKLDSDACLKIRKKLGQDFYIIAAPSIMRRDFFIKIISSRKPYLKRWPRNLPFDFEKYSKDKIAEIIWHSLPNQELFATIDDDHGMPGYCLISRGLYPNRIFRDDLKILEFGSSSKLKTRWKEKLKKITPNIIRLFISYLWKYSKRVFYTLNVFHNN